MTSRASILALTITSLCSSAAQAAQIQLGLQATANLPIISSSTSVMGGAHIAGIWNLNSDLHFRSVLEGNLSSSFPPSVRLDLDLLKVNSATYYGAGIGSGLIFDMTDGGSSLPEVVLSPVVLLNAHALFGQNLPNNTDVEGILRLGPVSGIGLRYGITLL